MICNEAIPLLELLDDNQLENERVAELRQHLSNCTACNTIWIDIQKMKQRVERFMSAIEAPESMQQKIRSGLKESAAKAQEVGADQNRHIKIAPPEMVEEQLKQHRYREAFDLAPSAVPLQYLSAGQKEATFNSTIHRAFRPRTVLVERHELIRFGLKRVVSEVVEVVGEAANGMAATELVRRLRPDFVVLDVDLDVLNGVEVCRRVATELPNSNVLVLTDSYHATKYHNQLIRAGARGFCLKSSGPRTLFEAIEQVTRSLPYCDPKITQLVKQSPTTSLPNSNLTDREIEVLIRLDLRNKEIAEELDMKLRTVEKHIECILAKLKVPTRTAAALKAVQVGYVLLPKMPGRDPVTGISHEQTMSELQAELAIANEHLKALLKQNELLKEALSEKFKVSLPPMQEP